MALVNPNRVKETTETTGTGTYTLEGATGNFQGFTAVGDGNTCYYCCTDGTQFELGIGTFTASGTTLARTTILNSSNSNNAVSWSTGEKDIFVTLPSSKLVFEDASNNVAIGNNITVGGTVDGRDLAADGTKLDGIEASATADQTAAEIRTLVESATDSNVFTDADHTKLNGIEASATADQTDAEIRAAVEAATDSNVFTDADHTKLNGIEASATADQTKSDIDALNINADQVDGLEASQFLRSDTGDTASGDIAFAGGAGAVTINAGSDIRLNDGTWTGEATSKIQHHSTSTYYQYSNSGQMVFRDSAGANNFYFDHSGNFTANGNVTAYSDIKFKKDIVTIDNAVDKIKKMRGVYYTEKETERARTGVIAQELEKVLPEVVLDVEETNPTTGETTSSKAVDYGNMVGLLIEAIKEQQDEIERLKAILEG